MDEAIALIGNGPSAKDNADAFRDIKEPLHTVRMNFFMLEEGLPYGRDVHSYFWAVNRPALHQALRETVDSGRYAFRDFYSSVPINRMDYEHGKVRDDPFFPYDGLFDHWRVIGENDPLGRRMMSRPLPTLGVQALAAFAIQGVRRAYLFGLDFYQSEDSRYAWSVPEDLKQALGDNHTTPGYEAGAHSLEADLEFLQTIVKEFPDLEIVNHTHFRDLDHLVQGERFAPKFAINPRPYRGGPSAALDADGSGTGSSLTGFGDAGADRMLNATLARMQTQIKALEAKLALQEDQSLDIDRINRLFDLLSVDGLPHSDVIWVVHEMQSYAGVYRPLKTYLEVSNQTMHLRPRLLNLSDTDRRGARTMIDHIAAGPFRLMMNSIASFSDARVQRLIDKADTIGIYLHETEWTMENYRQKQPVGFERFQNCVSRATVFCVSPAQEAFVRETYAPRATVLVYNTVDTILPPTARRVRRLSRLGPTGPGITSGEDADQVKGQDTNQDAGSASSLATDQAPGQVTSQVSGQISVPLRVGMVGSYQPRKGTVLFTQVARDAMGGNISFEWVGKHNEGHVDREAITFHGAMPPDEAQDFIASLDVMFIPSRDDPQPLAALEAASRGVKLVCYAGIGTAEWVRDVGGCAVFDDYTPDAALAALETAIRTPLDYARIDAILAERFDPEVFAERVKEAIDEMSASAEDDTNVASAADRGLKILRSRTRLAIDRLPGAVPRQDWDRVLTVCQRLIDRPDDTMAYSKVARRLLAMGERDMADKIVMAAIANNPTKASARREAAIYFFDTDRIDTAYSYAIEARDANPKSTGAQRILEKIEARRGTDTSEEAAE